MIQLARTTTADPAFAELVRQLDAELAIRDGEEYAFYAQFNGLDDRAYAVVAYAEEVPVGCGAIKPFAGDTVEVKRMFVDSAHRNKRIASRVLQELEAWATELGYTRSVLETGKRQPEAVALYHKNGYERIANYGQYAGVENSLCFEKHLTP